MTGGHPDDLVVTINDFRHREKAVMRICLPDASQLLSPESKLVSSSAFSSYIQFQYYASSLRSNVCLISGAQHRISIDSLNTSHHLAASH